MARPIVVEKTDDEVIVQSTDRYFRRVANESPPIGAAYDGKYACWAIVVTDIALSEAQLDSLEDQIGDIAGVHKAFVRIGSSRIPVDRVPEGSYLWIGTEAGFNIVPTPEEPPV